MVRKFVYAIKHDLSGIESHSLRGEGRKALGDYVIVDGFKHGKSIPQ
jgi:hypothetical protein